MRRAFLLLVLFSAGAHAETPIRDVPFAGYGDARVNLACLSLARGGDAWAGECGVSGNLQGDEFALSLDHSVRFGSAGCALVLPSAEPADIACRKLGHQFGSWLEVGELLGTPCRAKGTVWSRVAAQSEHDPLFHVVSVELELLIDPG